MIRVRHAFIGDAVEVPGLVCEDRDRAAGRTERLRILVVDELVELEADRGREPRIPAPDLGDAVGLLNGSDVRALGVTAHAHRMTRDSLRLT